MLNEKKHVRNNIAVLKHVFFSKKANSYFQSYFFIFQFTLQKYGLSIHLVLWVKFGVKNKLNP